MKNETSVEKWERPEKWDLLQEGDRVQVVSLDSVRVVSVTPGDLQIPALGVIEESDAQQGVVTVKGAEGEFLLSVTALRSLRLSQSLLAVRRGDVPDPEGKPEEFGIVELRRRSGISVITLRKYLDRHPDEISHRVEDDRTLFLPEAVDQVKGIKRRNMTRWGPIRERRTSGK